ncbi:hypothetical protein L6303_02695 [archaeon]|nr:hypothetical protein [Nanoarchaeota archaeon]MCG2723628.1 hypothetical protein [archaeon]
MNWTLYAWLKRGHRRKSILTEIYRSKDPLTANDISKKKNLAISQVSFTLKELLNMQLTECLNLNDKIGKLYRISAKGKEILNEV